MVTRPKQEWTRLPFAVLILAAFMPARCFGQTGATRDDIKVLIYYLPRDGFDVDGRAVQSYFQSAMFPDGNPANTQGVEAMELDGKVTSKGIRQQIRDLSVARGKTTVVTYFSAHGGIVDKKQVVQISASEKLTIDDLRQWIIDKEPGLGLIICDACSTIIPEKGPPPGTFGASAPSTFDQFFLKPRGKVYTLMAASPKEPAFGDYDGGCFTKALLSALEKYDPEKRENSNRIWDKFFPKVKDGTQVEFDALKDRYKNIKPSNVVDPDLRRSIEAIRGYNSQTPEIKSVRLPTGRSK